MVRAPEKSPPQKSQTQKPVRRTQTIQSVIDDNNQLFENKTRSDATPRRKKTKQLEMLINEGLGECGSRRSATRAQQPPQEQSVQKNTESHDSEEAPKSKAKTKQSRIEQAKIKQTIHKEDRRAKVKPIDDGRLTIQKKFEQYETAKKESPSAKEPRQTVDRQDHPTEEQKQSEHISPIAAGVKNSEDKIKSPSSEQQSNNSQKDSPKQSSRQSAKDSQKDQPNVQVPEEKVAEKVAATEKPNDHNVSISSENGSLDRYLKSGNQPDQQDQPQKQILSEDNSIQSIQQFEKSIQQERQQQKEQLSNEVDIVICCDTSGSIGEYLQKSIKIIETMKTEIDNLLTGADTKFGFVCYRDYPIQDNSYVTKTHDLSDSQSAIKFISEQTSSGGGDIPEAVLEGLFEAGNSITWRKGRRYIIHIADAPPHGQIYGIPTNKQSSITLEQVVTLFNNKEIHYQLIKIGTYLDKFSVLISKELNHFDQRSVTTTDAMIVMIQEMMTKSFE